MSPLLGSTGGSSEYAYRGTLDDWPNDFSAALSAQDLPGISPTDNPVATLIVTGINYKVRVVVNSDNALLSVDGGLTYIFAREIDPEVLVRDNATIKIKLQPTSGTQNDFNVKYSVPVRIGKKTAYWNVQTRPISQTPTAFTFTPLINQEIGITTTSNTITIAGLEPGFSFPISVTATDNLGSIGFFQNGTGTFTTGTVQNGDTIYLATVTPTTYSTPRSFSVTVGNYTTPWGVLTRNAITTINPISFVGVGAANSLGQDYISNIVTLTGADNGPTTPFPATDPTALPVTISGIGFSYLVIKPDNTLRYPDWQNQLNYAYNNDRIEVKIKASTNYSTTVTGILTVSNQTANYIVTTRATPINTIPNQFVFTDVSNQPRGGIVTSAPITLTGMTAGATDFGTASIDSSVSNTTTAIGINPQFEVNNSGTWISPPTTAQVKNGDQIRLRMATPDPPNQTTTTSSIVFGVRGTDTRTNNVSGNGFITITTPPTQDTWSVGTIPRTCTITPFTLSTLTGVTTNTTQTISFIPVGFDIDCNMSVSVTSNSTAYNFISITPPGGTASAISTKSISNVLPGSIITLQVLSSSNYLTSVTSTVLVTNQNTTTIPGQNYSTNWVVQTVPDQTPASLSFFQDLLTQQVNNPVTLGWNSINCTSVRAVSWPTISGVTTLSVNSGSAIVIPPVVGIQTYTMSVYINSAASNAGTFPSDIGGIYIEKSVNVNVTQDTTPQFIPTNFPAALNAPLYNVANPPQNNFTISSPITITSISTSLQAKIDTTLSTFPTAADTSIYSYQAAGAATSTVYALGSIQSQTVNDGDSIALRVKNSSSYSTTTVGVVSFTDTSVTPPSFRDSKTFSVTTVPCIPAISAPITIISTNTSVNFTYYITDTQTGAGPNWTNLSNPPGIVQLSATNQKLLYAPLNQFSTSTNNFSYYYLDNNAGSLSGFLNNTNSFANTITWNAFINIAWNCYTVYAQRPPTDSEINSLLATAANATTLQGYATNIANLAKGTSAGIARTSSAPLYNSCPNGVIISGAYPNPGPFSVTSLDSAGLENGVVTLTI